MFDKNNIKFDIHNNRVVYNALRTFTNYSSKIRMDTVKIPTYVIREVFMHKMSLDLYCNGNYERTYSYDNLKNYLFKHEEPYIYKGFFRSKEINYKLNKVEVRKYLTYSSSPCGKRSRSRSGTARPNI